MDTTTTYDYERAAERITMFTEIRWRIKSRWQDLMAGFWFLALLSALLGPALAYIAVWIDRAAGSGGAADGFIIGPSSARTILSTIASSLVTVAGLTASLTIVTLQLLSGQYTPRALRGFLSQHISQLVVGCFIGLFAYCLLVLRTVRTPGDHTSPFVPSFSVAAAIVLALLALALLLGFIHYMAQTIQVSNLAARITRDTMRAADRLYPRRWDEARDERGGALVQSWHAHAPPQLIYPRQPGYVQSVALDAFVTDAKDPDLRLHLTVCPGDFVTTKTAIAAVWPADTVTAKRLRAIRRHMIIRSERDIIQDPGFGIRQLTGIALRAISLGINDPTTAVTCIGYLQNIFECLADRDLPSTVTYTLHGPVTVVARHRAFEEYVEVFEEIARYATGDVRVAGCVLDALIGVAEAARAAGAGARVALLTTIAAEVAAPALAGARTDRDHARITERLRCIEDGAVSRPRAIQ
jgi:uncharacterized membrane protein